MGIEWDSRALDGAWRHRLLRLGPRSREAGGLGQGISSASLLAESRPRQGGPGGWRNGRARKWVRRFFGGLATELALDPKTTRR